MIRTTAALLTITLLMLLGGCDESAQPPEGYDPDAPTNTEPVEAPPGAGLKPEAMPDSGR